jgi:hypothetical protein
MSEPRRLNEAGIQALEQYLADVAADPSKPVPTPLLTDPGTSEPLPVQLEVQEKQFASRLDAAAYLYDRLGKAEAAGLDREPGIWAWLALFYFDQLCPLRDGMRIPGALARWIPSGHAWRYYRHLLAGPYLIYKAFRDDPSQAAILLAGRVEAPGEIVEQLASRQEIIQNKALVEAATKLYLNKSTGKAKRGVTNKDQPGTVRRFADLINQLDINWDLFSMDADHLLNRLPAEFDAFKDGA